MNSCLEIFIKFVAINTFKKMAKKNKKQIECSTNKIAERVVGKRNLPENAVIFDQPSELGYHCPVCKYKTIRNGEYDGRLHWSEYNGFLWCQICDKDYPSAFCVTDIDKAIGTYLACVEQAKEVKA